ncbi:MULTISPECIES: GAF domain-containing protein [unclassified Moorena]|uniref:sensor histidine kinase n=1 Tax=unclassified Moorena TaxID=2683338 RepID=UPI0013C93EF1|nr:MULTISPECIES: GAF domain-containing protein [unclassified Moorena]NEO21077.1 GAF domain-containing protein [Moorena sp. SIO4A5]NEQ61630.1 GAF domain-containing protein [Moorena sp. SIO4A1]
MMRLEQFQILRELTVDEAAFEQLQEILLAQETKYQKAQEQIHFKASLLDHLPSGIIAIDMDGKIIHWNSYACKLYQWQAQDVIGSQLSEIMFPPRSDAPIKEIFAQLSQLEVWQGELLIQRQDGSRLASDFTISVLQDQVGKQIGFVATVVDAKEGKQAEINRRSRYAIGHRPRYANALSNQVAQDKLRQAMGDSLRENFAARIRKSLDVETILNTTVNEVRRLLQADRVAVYRFESDWRGRFTVESVESPWQPITGREMYNPHFWETHANQYRYGPIQAIEDIYSDSGGLSSYEVNCLAQLQVVANLVVPIICHPQLDQNQPKDSPLWGLLVAHQCSRPRQWQLWERNLWKSVADHVGIAIQQAQIYQENQLKAQREATLNKFTQKIRSSLDLEQIFTTATQEISQLLDVDLVEIQEYLPQRQVWLTVSQSSKQANLSSPLGAETPDVDNEISRKIKNLEVVRINNSCNLNLQDSCHQLLVPLRFQNRLWGKLCLINIHSDYQWSDGAVTLVQSMAEQLAIAIQQGQLYQRLANLNTDLERQVLERTQQLRERIKELQRLNILKDDFLSTVSHELRTPLSNMKMAIQMLKIAPESQRRQRYTEILESECYREIELINDLLDLQRLETASYQVSRTVVDLKIWLRRIIDSFCSRIQAQQQILKLTLSDNLPSVLIDKTSFGRIVTELFNNACKYTPGNRQIILEFFYQNNRDLIPSDTVPKVIFKISNQAEIADTELPHIFDKFYRIPNADPWKRGGTGLGLALVKQLVKQLDGIIQVESSQRWTTFTVQIPAPQGSELNEHENSLTIKF